MPDFEEPGLDPEGHDQGTEGSPEDEFGEALDDLEADEGEGLSDEGDQEPPVEDDDLDTSGIPEGPGRDAVARWKQKYNRKMDELQRREEALAPQLTELQYKSQVLDRLLADKEINEALRRIRDRRMSQGNEPRPDGKADPTRVLEAKLEERIAPIQKQVQQMQLDNMAANFATKHPDWEKYFPRMQKMWATYGQNLPYEAAYRLAKYGAVEERLQARKPREGVPPQRRSGTKVPTGDRFDVKDFDSALDAALVMHKIPKERFFKQ